MASIKRILLTLVAAGSISTTTIAQINAEQIMAIGRNVLSMDDYMLAIQYFNQAIKAKPYIAEPYYLRALAKMNLEDFKGAEEDCSLAIERNKFITDAYRLRGYCRSNLNKDSLAIEDFDKGLHYMPNDKYFLYYKSVALMRIKKYAASDSLFTHLLTQYPNFEEAFTARAHTRIMHGDTIGALKDIDIAISKQKDDINNYLMRAEINFNLKKWENVAKDLDQAIKLDPKQPDLYINRAFVKYNLDDYNGTISDYNMVLELQPENIAARYNRALLKYELRDFKGAYSDFSIIIEKEPDNFHARYNHALLAMDLKYWREAMNDFQIIARKYPRFYPIYYGMAQCKDKLGDHTGAIKTMLYAEDMVRKYVDNPKKNPLDRPIIEPGKSNTRGEEREKEETDEDVMNRFNHLITVIPEENQILKYSDQIKGKVQDRSERVQPQPIFALTIFDSRTVLRPISNYFKDIEEINSLKLLPQSLYFANTLQNNLNEEQSTLLFSMVEDFNAIISNTTPRAIDYFGRGVTQTLLKNFTEATKDFDKAIELNPQFALAYMARAYSRKMDTAALIKYNDSDIIADYNRVLELSPRLIYAWYNKGIILYTAADFEASEACFTRALEINPEFAEAYFNRALVYLSKGNIKKAFDDLSRAGELGILQAYSLMKNMQK